MIKYIDADGVEHDVFITDNNYRPGQLADENGVISNYYTNTVSGTDNIVVEHTYNDKIDLLKIYGKSVQDGEPSPDNPVEIQSVGGTLTVRSGQEYMMPIPEVQPYIGSKGIRVGVDATQKITLNTVIESLAASATCAIFTADEGLVFQNYGAYITVIDSPDQCWALAPNTYYVNVFDYVGESLGERDPVICIYRYDPEFSSVYHPIVASTPLVSNLTIQFEVEEFGYYGIQIVFGGATNKYNFGDDGISFQLSVTNVPSTAPYQPDYPSVTMEIPTLYGVGDVSDVLYVDRAQGRAWVERNFVKIEPTQIRGVYNLNVYDITQCFVVTGSNMRPRNDNSTISGLCNYLEYVGKGLNVNTFYRDETIAFMHWSALDIFYIKIPYENLGVERGVDGTTMKEAGSNWLASCNPPFVFLTEANTAQIEELDYVALPTFPKNTIISVDSAVAPVVEATVKGYLADDYNNVTATALIALGVESSADQAENLEMLTELGVNPYE